MKAPDKIYIEQKAIMYNIVNTEPCKEDDIEYICKDALLEWLGEQLTASYNSMDIRSNLAYSRMIDKIKSL